MSFPFSVPNEVNCETAIQLMKTWQKSPCAQYDSDSVDKVIAEMREWEKQLLWSCSEGSESSIKSEVLLQAHQTNKRILLAYHKQRMQMLEDLYFQQPTQMDPLYASKLHRTERIYWECYDKLVTQYVQKVGIDIRRNLKPPGNASEPKL